jgi:hypothetical protein
MTRGAIERLGALSYGSLLWAVVSSHIQRTMTLETNLDSPALILLNVVNGVVALATIWCIICFIDHVLGNKRLGGAGKVLWLALLLFGNVVTMPVYWYLFMVRDRIGETAGSASALSEGVPGTDRNQEGERKSKANSPDPDAGTGGPTEVRPTQPE